MYDNVDEATSLSDTLSSGAHGISEKLLRGDSDIDEHEFNNLEIFEHILDYLEFYQEPKCSANCEISIKPSTNILRLLVTLLARSITHETFLDPTGDTFAFKRADYLLHWELSAISIRGRVLSLIRKYVDELLYDMDQGSCLLKKSLYNNFLSLLNDFIKKNSANDQTDIPSKKKMNYHSFPEKALQGSSKSPHSVLGAINEDDSIICDSEDELLLDLDFIKNSYFFCEYQKKHDVNREKGQGQFLNYSDFKMTRVLGYELLSLKLNPLFNSPYSLWDLIDWTFFCAKCSFKKAVSPFYVKTSRKGVIFETYNGLIDNFLDLIAIDLAVYLKYDGLLNNLRLKYEKVTGKDSVAQKGSNDQYIFHNCETGRGTLLEGFLNQLSFDPFDLYEKASEHIFCGLIDDGNNPRRPSPCYAEESLLILDEENSEENSGVCVESRIEESLNTRVKLLYIIYYWSKFSPTSIFQTRPKNTKKDLLSTESFLRVLAKKIWSLEFQLFKAFFNTFTSVRYNILENWNSQRNNMIMSVLKYIFLEIGDAQLDQFFRRTDFLSHHENTTEDAGSSLYDLISTLCEEQLYINILDDQTFKTIEDLKNCWLKYNYLLYYVLGFTVKFYDSHCKLSLREKKETIQKLFSRIKEADTMKEKIYQGFLKERFILNQQSEKTHVEYNFILTESQLREHTESDIGLPKFANMFFCTFNEYLEE